MTLGKETIWLNEEQGGDAGHHSPAWLCVGKSPPILFTALSLLVVQAGGSITSSATACLSRGTQLHRYLLILPGDTDRNRGTKQIT
jgi:hypothetical protein